MKRIIVLILITVFAIFSAVYDVKADENHVSCKDFTEEGKTSCIGNDEFSCLWVNKKVNGKKWEYCNFDDLLYVSCGTVMDLPYRLPSITSFFVNSLKIATPILLVFVSIISLIKALSSSVEDEIKKAQKTLIKRIIVASLVFFVIQITQFVMIKVSNSGDHKDITSCLSCLLNNSYDSCRKNVYYKTQGINPEDFKNNSNFDKSQTYDQKYTCTYQNGDVTMCY